MHICLLVTRFNRDGEITPWLIWFLECVSRAILSSNRLLSNVMQKAHFWKHYAQTDLNHRQRKALNRILDAGPGGFEGGLTNRKYAGMTHIRCATAQRELADLVKKGILSYSIGFQTPKEVTTMPKPIYLDYNATTPHDPEVIEAMRPFLEEEFGNPSSSHLYGSAPQKAVMEARRRVAALLSCRPEEITFTGGGTESNNHAIKGVADAYGGKGNHIITSRIEHPAVLEVCGYLEKKGMEVTYLPVDGKGMVSVSAVEAAVRPHTVLITIMHANNEVGTLQPIAEIAKIAKQQGILLHTDAAQSVGKIPTAVDTLGVDLLSVAGHKVYAPKGVGALFIRNGVKLTQLMQGAGQESGRRPGTENVLEIVGLGKACEIAGRDLDRNMTHMNHMRDRLYEGLKHSCGNIRVNGHPQKRLPNTLSISFEGLEANRILDAIESEVAASAGAACHSDTVQVSVVLKAMKVPLNWAKGTLRLTTGRRTTETDIDTAVEVICEAVNRLKA